MEACAARAQDGPRLVPVGIGNTVALAMEEECDKVAGMAVKKTHIL